MQSLAGALDVILRQHHRSLSAEQMDARFVERVERAFQNGSEHRQSAAMNGANASRER
jgi:hypothetical protein